MRILTRLGWSVTAGLAVATGSLTVPTVAEATTPQALLTLRNVASGYCVTLGTVPDVYAATCVDGLMGQEWRWGFDSKLINARFPDCLDGDPVSGRVALRPCDGSDRQKWRWDGPFLYQPSSGKVLDADGAGQGRGTVWLTSDRQSDGTQYWSEVRR